MPLPLPAVIADDQRPFLCMESETVAPVASFALLRNYMHIHLFHEVFFCTHGGWQVSSRGLMPIQKDALLFLPARHPHIAVANKGDRCTGTILYLPEDLFSRVIEGDRDTRCVIESLCRRADDGEYQVPLTTAGTGRVGQLFRDMARESRLRAPGYKSAIKSSAQALFLTILRESAVPDIQRDQQPSNKRERVAEALCYLHAHYARPITVARMLELTKMGRSQFHAVFKAETGTTLAEYVNTLRLTTAEQLLRDSDLSITEIAFRCGFASLSYFYRVFTARFGRPPRAYRRAE
ncbi:MAG TPA: AraC family transcriptional regulator [Armatimonadota bacterium]|jgi:AraC-like DNA-binding protein